MDHYSLHAPALDPLGGRVDVEIVHHVHYEDGRRLWCSVRVRGPGFDQEARSDDCFEALLRVRETLEPAGWRLLVWGASVDVWPSGMARDMGAGLWAYRMRYGSPASSQDAVGVFDTGPEVIPCTVSEQAAYYAGWLASLGSGTPSLPPP